MNIVRELFLLIITGSSLNAATVPPVPSQYFNDYAGVIAPRSVAYFNDLLAQFERETSNQIIVAIYATLDPDTTLEQFARDAFRAWKLGQAGRDNGVLVLVFVDDRKVRIQTGLGLVIALPDTLCGEIITQHMAPRFRKGDYSGALEAALNNIMNATRDAYKGDGQTAAEKEREGHQRPTPETAPTPEATSSATPTPEPTASPEPTPLRRLGTTTMTSPVSVHPTCSKYGYWDPLPKRTLWIGIRL